MKLFKYALVLFISISIVSCGSDDDSPSYEFTSENLVGTYELTALETESVTDVTYDGTTSEHSSETVVGDSFDEVYLTFTDSNYTVTGSYRLVIETTSSDGEIEESTEIVTLDGVGTYSINETNETITFVGDEIDGVFNVDTFTSSKLVLTQENIEDEDPFTTTSNSTITFER